MEKIVTNIPSLPAMVLERMKHELVTWDATALNDHINAPLVEALASAFLVLSQEVPVDSPEGQAILANSTDPQLRVYRLIDTNGRTASEGYAAMACCRDHLAQALGADITANRERREVVVVTDVTKTSKDGTSMFQCFCKKPADYYLRLMEAP